MLKKLIIPVLSISLVAVMVISLSAKASAYNYTNYPMNDSTFLNDLTMTATQIQNFLAQENSGLVNFQGQLVCGFSDGNNFNFYNQHYACNEMVTSNGSPVKDAGGYDEYETSPQSAALIIAEASQAYGINPQVVLATMQKEQSLVTTPNPTSSQLNFAMGYGCPDSGGCSYPGFFNQVDNATWQFRTDWELSSGHNYWGYTPSAFPCNGSTKYYSEALVPGNDVTFFDDHGNAYANFTIPNAATGSLYCYTPHVFPGSSAEYYSGNYWFVYYFSLWFGNSSAPYAFKSSSSDTVYLFVDGYKVVVPYMGMLQDYGINPNAIQILSPTTVSNIPTPSVSSNGISPTLSSVITTPSNTDADGANIYLVTVGQKYAFQSNNQLTDYGFSLSGVATLPLDFIENLPGQTNMSNYISTPDSSAFYVSSDSKNLIFSYKTYLNMNPSNNAVPVSYYVAGLIPSGNPINNSPFLVQLPGTSAVYLMTGNNYYTVGTYSAYNCWGFANGLNLPLYVPSQSSYIGTITSQSTLSNCIIGDGSGDNYLLSASGYYSIPGSSGISGTVMPSSLLNIALQLPNEGALKSYIKPAGGSAVYNVSSGGIYLIPTYTDYKLLGITPSQTSTVDSSTTSSFNYEGVDLGTGQVINIPGSSAVYGIVGNNLVLYPTSVSFLSYRNNWNSINSYSESLLGNYQYNSQSFGSFFYDSTNNTAYMMDSGGCYIMNSSLLNDYGQSLSNLETNYSYTSSDFPNLNLSGCNIGSIYAKEPGQAAVYELVNGTKYPFSGWNSLVQTSGTNNPYIISVSDAVLGPLPTGSPL